MCLKYKTSRPEQPFRRCLPPAWRCFGESTAVLAGLGEPEERGGPGCQPWTWFFSHSTGKIRTGAWTMGAGVASTLPTTIPGPLHFRPQPSTSSPWHIYPVLHSICSCRQKNHKGVLFSLQTFAPNSPLPLCQRPESPSSQDGEPWHLDACARGQLCLSAVDQAVGMQLG